MVEKGQGCSVTCRTGEGQGCLQQSGHTQNANSIPIEKQTFKRTWLGKCSIKTSQNFLGGVQRASTNVGAAVDEAWGLLLSCSVFDICAAAGECEGLMWSTVPQRLY